MNINPFIIILGSLIISSCLLKDKDADFSKNEKIVKEKTAAQINIIEPDSSTVKKVDISKPMKIIEYNELPVHWIIDTLIDGQVRLQINPELLETFVFQEYIEGDTLIRLKHFDIGYKLTIQNNGLEILDTLFTKQTFVDRLDSTFFSISHFHGYWLNDFKKENNALLMFGNICKPDTDWCFFFNHQINIKTGVIELLIPKDEEEI